MGHLEFLQEVLERRGPAGRFPEGFPWYIQLVLMSPLVVPGMSMESTTRFAYFQTMAAEELRTLMLLLRWRRDQMVEGLGTGDGEREASPPLLNAEPEDLDYDNNLNTD